MGFNHQMLCLARDSCGMTQAELAKDMQIAQGTLSKYEAGINVPPNDVVEQFAEKLGFPANFFFQNEQPYGFPPFHFRKRKKLGVKALNRIVAEMNIRRMHVKKLLVSYKPSASPGLIPEIDQDEYQGTSKTRPTTEDLARHLRELWGVPKGPIENMVELIERNGGIVIPCDFGSDLIDAMSQRIDGLPVMFFVNINAPADRVRHTLAHELGHMVLHTLKLSSDEEMEDEADAFAGAFLVPADEFRPQMRRFDLQHLATLKAYWRVSMQALAYRAGALGLITSYQSKRFWMEMNRLHYRKHEPGEVSKEHPKALERMVSYHQTTLGYSTDEMAHLLAVRPQDFARMYLSNQKESSKETRPYIRLVK